MKLRLVFFLSFIIAAPLFLQAQQITFSEPFSNDGRNANYDILGRITGNIVVFKNERSHYAVNIFNDSMLLKEQVELDFLPGRTFNVDYVAYPGYFFLIYQYQQKGILYCMGIKMDGNGKKAGEPVELDTTKIGSLGDNKIYSAINSDDRKRIMIFKIQRRDDKANFVTKLYDNDLQLLHQTRTSIDYDTDKNSFGDFFVDNDGNFVFTNTERKNNRDNPSAFYLVRKEVNEDTFRVARVAPEKIYLDELKMKIDNVNRKYIVSSLFYKERSGNVDGVYNYIWDAAGDSTYAGVVSEFNDELKEVAKSSGSSKAAFNDFFIRNIVLKKDGSFILTAEDFSSQASGMNNWNRYDYLYGSPYFNPYDYYYYSPSYYGFYRPWNRFGNQFQATRYYYNNILVLSVSKEAVPDWSNIIHKQQTDDNDDSYLSFNIFNTGGELHFLFNDISRRERLLSDNIVTPDGIARRNPTLRTYEKGYEMMPRYAKQTGARQVVVPATYRGQICFAKIDF